MPQTAMPRAFLKSPAQVLAEQKSRDQSLAALLPVSAHSKFSEYLDSCWRDARDAKRPVQQRMLKAAQNRKGEYPSEKLAAIRKVGGSEVFIPATNLKCTAAHDGLADIFNSSPRPFALEPTPIPSLPADLQMQVIERVHAEIMGAPPGMQFTPEMIDALDARATKEVNDALSKTAKERSERMTEVIDDRLKEGGWREALSEVIDDIVTYPAGILKGPVLRRKPKQVWVPQQDGSFDIVVRDDIAQEFDRVSPFDFYPQRNIRNVDEGYTFERLRLNRRKLTELKGLAGYNDSEIDAVLAECSAGRLKANWLWDTDTIADDAEERDVLQDSPEGRVDGLEFWGSVSGQWLRDWGMSEQKVPDPNREYQITAILVGTHIIRAVLNPHPLALKPYHVCSWRKTNGAFWGQGIPEIVEDIQQVLNAVVRSMVNNVAIAAGPQVAIDVALLPVGTNYEYLTPWKIHKLDSAQGLGFGGGQNNRLPIEFFQPTMQADILLRVVAAFTQMMDEYTGIPAYTHGVANQSGAAETASGQAMLISAAGKIIKNIAAKIDQFLIASSVNRVFIHEMRFNPDNSIKGDAQVVALGAGSIVAKEQQLVRTIELLNMTRNDVDMQVIGLRGRAELLREVFHRFDLKLDHIIPDAEELLKREEIMQMQILQKEQRRTGNLDKPGAKTLDAAGAPAGGTDNNLFPNQPLPMGAAA